MKQEIQNAIAAALSPSLGKSDASVSDWLLDAAKRKQSIPSNYRLARVLGVSDNTMTKWATGRSSPGDVYATRLANMAGLDPGVVLAELAAERSTDDETRDAWKSIAERLRHAGLAAIFGLAIGFAGPAPEARAFEVTHVVDQSGLCVM